MTLLRNACYNGASLVLKLFTTALLGVVLARCFGVEEFGRFSFCFALVGVFLVVMEYGFNLQTTREVAIDARKALSEVEYAINGKIILILACGAILTIVSTISGYPADTNIMLALFFLSAIPLTFGWYFVAIFRGVNKFQYEAIANGFIDAAIFAGAATVAFMGHQGVAVAVVYLVVRYCYLALTLKLLRANVGPIDFRISFSKGVSALRSSFPFGVHAILAMLYFQIDTVLLSYMKGNAEVGLYQAAMRVVIAVSLVSDVVLNASYPLASSKYSSDRDGVIADMRKMSVYLTVAGACIALCMVLFARPLVNLLYGHAYDASGTVLQILAGTVFLRFAGSPFALILTILDRQQSRATAVGISLVVSVASNMLLIPVCSVTGAAMASVLTHAFLFVIYACAARKAAGSGINPLRCMRLMAPWPLKAPAQERDSI